MSFFNNVYSQVTRRYSFKCLQIIQECIPVRYVPITAVAATRCQYWRGLCPWESPSMEISVQVVSLQRGGSMFSGISIWKGVSLPSAPMDRQTLLKTLFPLAVSNNMRLAELGQVIVTLCQFNPLVTE